MTDRTLRVQHFSSDEGRPHIAITFDMKADVIEMVLLVTNIPELDLVAGTLRDVADTIDPQSVVLIGDSGRVVPEKKPSGFHPRPAGPKKE